RRIHEGHEGTRRKVSCKSCLNAFSCVVLEVRKMKLRSLWLGGALALGLCLVFGQAQAQDAAKPIVQHTFEENTGDWQVMDALMSMSGAGKLSVTHEAANVKAGKGALQFNYGIKKGEMWLLLLPTPDGALTKMKSLKFWVKTD